MMFRPDGLRAAAAGVVDHHVGAAAAVAEDVKFIRRRVVVAQRRVHHQRAVVTAVIAVDRQGAEAGAVVGEVQRTVAGVERRAAVAGDVPLVVAERQRIQAGDAELPLRLIWLSCVWLRSMSTLPSNSEWLLPFSTTEPAVEPSAVL